MSFKTQVVKAEDAPSEGFAKFNNGQHLLVDLPTDDSTISVRTPDDKLVTFAFVPFSDTVMECVDIQEHTGQPIVESDISDNPMEKQKLGRPRQRVICFSGGGPDPYVSERQSEIEAKKPVTLVTLRLAVHE